MKRKPALPCAAQSKPKENEQITKAIWPVIREWLPIFITDHIDYFDYRSACRMAQAAMPVMAARFEPVNFLLWRKVLSPRR